MVETDTRIQGNGDKGGNGQANKGGLGIGNLEKSNKALVMKCCFCLYLGFLILNFDLSQIF